MQRSRRSKGQARHNPGKISKASDYLRQSNDHRGECAGTGHRGISNIDNDETKAKDLGLMPLAKILSVSSVAKLPRELAITPAFAIEKALSNANVGVDQIEIIEINEAFAAMPLVSCKILAKNDEKKMNELLQKTNINGGAIAIGHPVGASGARILMTLMYELKRRGGGYGACSICGGFGQGDGAIIKVFSSSF